MKITFAVYRPPRDDLPHLVVVLADGNILLAKPVKSIQEGEERIDYI